MISQGGGNAIQAALLDGPVVAALERVIGLLQEVAVGNTAIAHEWNPFIGNRLFFDGAGSSSNQACGQAAACDNDRLRLCT